jgi:hypothetical protein
MFVEGRFAAEKDFFRSLSQCCERPASRSPLLFGVAIGESSAVWASMVCDLPIRPRDGFLTLLKRFGFSQRPEWFWFRCAALVKTVW